MATEEIELIMTVVVAAARRLKVEPHTMLAAIQAVSITRRGSADWSQHDLDIAESCLGAWLAAGGPRELKEDC